MISIITPVLNGEQYIRTNIESIEKLSVDFEHIIVDGGSNDNTLNIIQQYPLIKLLHQKEKTGMYGAIDMGFREAKGDYFCWVNSDDKILPKAFEKLYNYAKLYEYDFVCSDGIIKDVNNDYEVKIKGTRFVKYFLRKGVFPFLQPSTIFTKKLYTDVNGLDYNRYKICGDMDLFYRMALLPESRFGYLPIKTAEFIKHGNSLGDNNKNEGIQERKKNLNLPKSKLFYLCLYKIVKFVRI
jgi:glycosyltransferase involved in cell wall biosynthesis